ncbi:MAG TPA: DUF2752 domain-containing protein [Lysobacter sp.]
MRSQRSQPGATAVVAAGAAAIALSVAWLLRSFDPGAAGSLFPPCLFHLITGLYCPGCGVTRALHALSHGDPGGAWAMNPLLLPGLLALLAVAWHQGVHALPGAIARRLFDGRLWIAVLLAFGVLRNLPWPAFAWMAPG